MEYRLGKKQKRVILNKKGYVVCTIHEKHKHLSNKILNALNADFNNERILAKKEKCDNYPEYEYDMNLTGKRTGRLYEGC